ncbi:MAG: NAD(P)/FAD-dependent oxidoreductase [Caldilineaceae bacterium]
MSRKGPPEPAGPPSVLIVGAGMTGLMLAASLPEYGHRISLVDKGRSAGGRLATRRFGAMRADHGAQFFSARTPEFGAWVERWQADGLVYVWSHGWGEGSAAVPTAQDGHPRYAVREGMNALAKRLAAEASNRGAAVHTGTRLRAISHTERGWWSVTDDGRVYMGHALVLTCPVPQALALLAAGTVTLDRADQQALERLSYAPCLCLMVQVQGEPNLPAPGALQRPQAVASWVADNRRKGLTPVSDAPTETVLTVHASPDYSAAHFGDSDEVVAASLHTEIAPLLEGCTVIESQVKRWRYAMPAVLHEAPFLRAAGLPPLFFAGDAFGAPRIEGAALSGMAVAAALKHLLD